MKKWVRILLLYGLLMAVLTAVWTQTVEPPYLFSAHFWQVAACVYAAEAALYLPIASLYQYE